MSGLKDVVKGGWHPKGKDGKKESWRAENKGINQVVCPSLDGERRDGGCG
jgi:hypothetical protein